MSDDDVNSGFRVDIPIPSDFSVQFSILPVALPADFSDTTAHRIFVGCYNRFGKMVGLLLSENQGVAIAQTGTSAYTVLPDTADLFDEGLAYYDFRVVCNSATNRADLYITRSDLIPLTGYRYRCSFILQDAPPFEVDHTVVEVVGSVTEPVEVHFDCWRLSGHLRIPNQRPVAIVEPEQFVVTGNYVGLDGRESYDPEGEPLRYWWTLTQAPDTTTFWITGTGTTPAHPSGYTDVVVGAAGDFSMARVGDLLYVGSDGAVIKHISADGSTVVLLNSVIPAGSTVAWSILRQDAWGGLWIPGSITDVVASLSAPPPLPATGAVYRVTAVASGDWTGHEEQLATWTGLTWTFASPALNDVIYDVAAVINLRYLGADYPSGIWEIDDPVFWEFGYWSGRTSPLAALLPDVSGLFVTELIVNDGVLNSDPAQTYLNMTETSVPFGIIPDVSWIWNYISDFWDLVSDKGKIDVVWSAFTQIAAGLLMELWQYDYSKAVLDIQRIFQKRWLHFEPTFEESNYEAAPATIATGVNLSGFSASPGTDAVSFDTGVTLPSVSSDYLLILDGVGYRVDRTTTTFVITRDALPADRTGFWQIRPTVTSQNTDFEYEGIGVGDTAIFEVDQGDTTRFDVECFVYGASAKQFSFDYAPISSYLTDYTVRFRAVVRRNYMRIDSSIVSVPRLQEVINIAGISGAPDPVYENHDYIVEAVDLRRYPNVVNSLWFRDTWFSELTRGYDGDTTSGTDQFVSAGASFLTTFGDADPTQYVLELATGRYRIASVDSDTTLTLESDCVGPDTGLAWRVLHCDAVPELLFAELTFLDNEPTIEANFGKLVGLEIEDFGNRSDDLDYLSAVRGLWYTYWFGPRPYNLRVGSQILLGLPFAEQAGTIIDYAKYYDSTRSRILIRNSDNTSLVRSYFFPSALDIETNPATGAPYALGDVVERFAPLCTGVEVTDYVEDPDWFAAFIGSGNFYEVWKTHMFGVFVDSEIFSITNLEFVMSYILKIKPKYTYPWFVVLHDETDNIDVADATVIGPVIPGSPYDVMPTEWPIYPTPVDWVSSPWEDRVTRAPAPVYDSTTRWPTSRRTGPVHAVPAGGLLLLDTPGRVPDGWFGPWPQGGIPGNHIATRAEGAHVLDDTDEASRFIHRLDSDSFAVDGSKDGDMEDTDPSAPWWPALPSAPTTRQKTTTEHYTGLRSLEIADVMSFRGCYQNFGSAIEHGFQVAVTCKVKVATGQAVFRLRDQDGTTYVAEVRRDTMISDWQDVVLHHWAVADDVNAVRLEIMTGPAGGHFYVDDVKMYTKCVPWDQWGLDRMLGGRTGGYTRGGDPDEDLVLQVTEGVAP
jgi:hypothetical protein